MRRRTRYPGLSLALLSLAFLSACGGEGSEQADGPPPNPLLQPENFSATAPETFVARLETTKGVIRIQVTREWAPLGADRFYNLVRGGYYDGVTFHRVMDGFMAEFGIHGDPWVNQFWRQATMDDEPVRNPEPSGTCELLEERTEHPHGAGLHQHRRESEPGWAGILTLR